MIYGRLFSVFYRWFLAVVSYTGGAVVVCSGLNLWSEVNGQLFGMFVWATFQAQTSYLGWYFLYNLQPLKGYLFAVIVMTTVHLLSVWFIFFKGDDQLPRWPFFKSAVRSEKHSKFKTGFEGKRIVKLFINGFVPAIWPIGFLSLKKNPLKFGMFSILAGNALKLTVFAIAFEFIVSTKDTLIMIVVITLVILAIITPYRRIIEKFSTNSNKLCRPE